MGEIKTTDVTPAEFVRLVAKKREMPLKVLAAKTGKSKQTLNSMLNDGGMTISSFISLLKGLDKDIILGIGNNVYKIVNNE